MVAPNFCATGRAAHASERIQISISSICNLIQRYGPSGLTIWIYSPTTILPSNCGGCNHCSCGGLAFQKKQKTMPRGMILDPLAYQNNMALKIELLQETNLLNFIGWKKINLLNVDHSNMGLKKYIYMGNFLLSFFDDLMGMFRCKCLLMKTRQNQCLNTIKNKSENRNCFHYMLVPI